MDWPERLEPPDWVDHGATPKKGLDLLGLRLPVQDIGNSLLDGITTITPSVRYLSFRCWTTHAYATARQPDDWKTFRAFADRVEAAIALGNLLVDPRAVGVIGHDGAVERLKGNPRFLALEPLVKNPAVSIYGNPSESLGLAFTTRSGLPGLTRERGVPLANAVQGFVDRSNLGRRLSAAGNVKSASVTDLAEFGKRVQIDSIPRKERRLLIELLLPSQPRQSEWPRLASYSLLLHLARKLGACCA